MEFATRPCERFNNNLEVKLADFRTIFAIIDLPNIQINSLQATNVIIVNSNTECIQYDVKFSIPINFVVDMKIIYPRETTIDENADIGKLRINICDDILKNEIISCTNYLQRQKNLPLALSVLKRCATAISQRKLVLDMLVLHSEGFIKYTNQEDEGIYITCTNTETRFKYFESHWRIQFDCVNNNVMDFIDFSICLLDRQFHTEMKPIASKLIEPNLDYNVKVDLWWKVIHAVSQTLSRDILRYENVADTSHQFVDVRSFWTIQTFQDKELIKCEIPESDDEDCVIIDDN